MTGAFLIIFPDRLGVLARVLDTIRAIKTSLTKLDDVCAKTYHHHHKKLQIVTKSKDESSRSFRIPILS